MNRRHRSARTCRHDRTLDGRRLAVAGTALLAGLLLGACGSGDHSSMPGMAGATSAAPAGTAAAFNDADAAFATHMIPHHQQAVEMAALADGRAADAEVKKLAARIKAAQDPEITTMTGWLRAWGQPAPAHGAAGMDMGHATMPGMMSAEAMKKLAGASGRDFDKEFLRMMVAHHQGAIEMAGDEVAGGSNPDAKALAQRIAADQQAEIDSMTQLLAGL